MAEVDYVNRMSALGVKLGNVLFCTSCQLVINKPIIQYDLFGNHFPLCSHCAQDLILIGPVKDETGTVRVVKISDKFHVDEHGNIVYEWKEA